MKVEVQKPVGWLEIQGGDIHNFEELWNITQMENICRMAKVSHSFLVEF